VSLRCCSSPPPTGTFSDQVRTAPAALDQDPMSLPWTLAYLIAANVATITAILFVRRRAPEGSYFKDGDRASGVFGVLAGGFAIFAGFIIFLTFSTYDQSRSGGEAEALTVVQQFETTQFLPAVQRDRMAGEVVCYGRSVVYQEWPQMEAGKGGDAINPWGLALFRSLKLAEPESASEQAAYGKWLDQTSDREEARRDRLHGAEGIVPASIWLVLFLIAGVVFAFMLFFADSGEGRTSQAMLMGSATTVIVLTLTAISALGHPYRSGTGQIQPAAMQRSLRMLDTARVAVNDSAPLPCDARGVPVRS
jgi:fumarate reductase subunit D